MHIFQPLFKPVKFISAVKPPNSHTCKHSHSKTIGVQLKREEWRNKGKAECDKVSEEGPEHWTLLLDGCWPWSLLTPNGTFGKGMFTVSPQSYDAFLSKYKEVCFIVCFDCTIWLSSSPFSNMFLSKSGRSLKWVGFLAQCWCTYRGEGQCLSLQILWLKMMVRNKA